MQKFNSPSRIAKLKEKILNFQQIEWETLFKAWDRYKTMLINYPHYDLNVHQELHTLYYSINLYTRQLGDSQGPITKRNLAKCKEIIKNLANLIMIALKEK